VAQGAKDITLKQSMTLRKKLVSLEATCGKDSSKTLKKND
jgi:hypothetical protein